MKKETQGFSFSYLDVFLLLILGLVLSVVLYFVLETPSVLGEKNAYEVELSAYLDEALWEHMPSAKDSLFDQNGEKIGEILSVKTKVLGNRAFCQVTCRITSFQWPEEDTMRVETQNFVCEMQIDSAKPEENLR